MKVSNLKYQLEIMDLNHKHEIEILKLKQEQEKKELLISCTHRYDDGSSAEVSNGVQWDLYYTCNICGINL